MRRELLRDPPAASRRGRFFAILALSPLLLLPSLSLAAPITVPTSLLPSAQYRLAFVTEGTRDATSTNIADYDAFVTAQANTETALSSITWQVLGSTALISARLHTGTAPSDYPGVPIFLLNDVKLADDYADLWDATIDVPLGIDQHGNAVLVGQVWTGSQQSGLDYLPYELGTPSTPVVGDLAASNSTWMTLLLDPFTNNNRMYAISEILTVPEPIPSELLALGFAALLLVRRVRLS